ncbi:hypothetical protein JGC56_02830 [Salmonella enterica subsp. enterica serovar Saintpaul]|nr:hypothetical protein [Salmonella enterica subsp. enterica serovar Saintpaul]
MLAQCPLVSMEAIGEVQMSDEQRQRLVDLRVYAIELAQFFTTADLTQELEFPTAATELFEPI